MSKRALHFKYWSLTNEIAVDLTPLEVCQIVPILTYRFRMSLQHIITGTELMRVYRAVTRAEPSNIGPLREALLMVGRQEYAQRLEELL